MTQELLRDDSLPYREYIQRPGEKLDYGFEWAIWLAFRWAPGLPVAASQKIRPRISTGFEYVATTAGQSAQEEPAWPTVAGQTVQDGSVTWTCQAITTASLLSTISGSAWASDSPVTVPTTSLTGTNTTGFVQVPSNCPDGDYYVRNTITLANTENKIGVLLIKVRAKQT